MLSSGPSMTGGPLRPSPVQGLDKLQLDGHCPRTLVPAPIHVSVTASLEPQLPQSPTACLPPAQPSSQRASLLRRDTFNVDTGSPRIQSPLRHSYSSADIDSLGIQDPHTSRPSSLDMSYTGDMKTGAPAHSASRRKTGSFGSASISGSQGPTRWTASAPMRSRSASTTPKLPSTSPSSRFAFFTSSMSALKELTSPPVPVPQNDDELMYLDIDAALFPAGPNDGSTFSPAAYKNLQMTASGLLSKYQIAFQQRTIEFRELKADQDAQREETDEAETRVQHLKMQLEEISRTAAQRERAIEYCLNELALEKQTRMDLEQRLAQEKAMAPSGESVTSEDLGAEEDQNKRDWRKSGETSKSEETDEESIGDASVFSRSRSPTISTNMSEISPSPIDAPPQVPPKPSTLDLPRQPRSSNPPMTTFQKLFKGPSGEPHREDGRSSNTCRNCHRGQDASMAWDTVNLLKDENKGLKIRIEELETAVEGALDAVNGLML
ncbi:Fc.00g077640.m01.CDS01 [Cosmosporella sp. VM-42]